MRRKAEHTIEDKIKTPEAFEGIARRLRKEKKVLVQCDGVFDLVHPGHIDYFTRAKNEGDALYVVLVGDKYVVKGPGRPLFDETTRARWIASLGCVDFVVVNSDFGPYKVIEKVRPHVLVKGEAYRAKPTEGFLKDKALIESYGGRVAFVPELMHSTELIQKIYRMFD